MALNYSVSEGSLFEFGFRIVGSPFTSNYDALLIVSIGSYLSPSRPPDVVNLSVEGVSYPGLDYSFSSYSVSLNAPRGMSTPGGTFLSYQLGYFATGTLSGSLDFESYYNPATQSASVPVSIQFSSDNYATASAGGIITISDVNEAPSFSSVSELSVLEGQADVIIAPDFLKDPDVYTAVFRQNNFTVSDNRFVIAPSDTTPGSYDLKLLTLIDFESPEVDSFAITITATDSNFTIAKTITINVNDINEAPTAIALSANSVTENMAGVVIGDLTVSDPDTKNAAFRNNTLSIDNDKFEVLNGQLKLKSNRSLNYEDLMNGQLTINVTATDETITAGKNSFSQSFTINVTDVNDAPTANDDSGFTGRVGVEKAISISALLSNDTDPDTGDTKTITNITTTNGSIRYDASNIYFTPNITGTTKFSYTIKDKGGLADDATVSVIVGQTFNSGNGKSSVEGTAGDDLLLGSNGKDILFGYVGDDILIGGRGNDTVTGGAGADLFVIAKDSGSDTFTDFTPSTDRIGLAGGLKYTDLYFQGNNIFRGVGGELLATLQNVQTSTLNQNNFLSYTG